MSTNTIKFLFSVILVVSVIAELFALYTGQFANNELPIVTYIYDLVIVIALVTIDKPIKLKPIKVFSNKKLRKSIDKQAEKYYMSTDINSYDVPDTREIWITPSAKKRFDITCEFDENTINLIKQQRYTSAAEYMNNLQEKDEVL